MKGEKKNKPVEFFPPDIPSRTLEEPVEETQRTSLFYVQFFSKVLHKVFLYTCVPIMKRYC